MKLIALVHDDDGTEEAVLETKNGARVHVKHTNEGLILSVYPDHGASESVGDLTLEDHEFEPEELPKPGPGEDDVISIFNELQLNEQVAVARRINSILQGVK